MDDKIAIAPNWAGEVRILFEVQAKMADILGAVDGLALGAQDDLRNSFRIISFIEV